jgi:hypothetical protein
MLLASFGVRRKFFKKRFVNLAFIITLLEEGEDVVKLINHIGDVVEPVGDSENNSYFFEYK